jgi:hypothetical protein
MSKPVDTSRQRRRWSAHRRACWIVAVNWGCSSVELVSVMPSPARPLPSVEHTENVLRVQLDTSSIRLPLHLSGTNVAFTDMDRALRSAIEQAITRPRTHPFNTAAHTLHVELLGAQAEASAGRIVVSLFVRATLRRKNGNAFVAQTHAHATQSGSYTSSNGVDAVINCASTIGAELEGWVSGLEQP